MYHYKVVQYEDSSAHVQDKSTGSTTLKIMAVACSVVVLGAVAYVASSSSHFTPNNTSSGYSSFVGEQQPPNSGSRINYTFRRSNYQALPYFDMNYDSILNYQHLQEYRGLLEPYVPMELHLYDRRDQGTNPLGFSYKFEVCPADQSPSGQGGKKETECLNGSLSSDPVTSDRISTSVQFGCTPYEKYVSTVREYDATGTLLREQKDSLLCSYVCRELRTLTPQDLNTFLDASALIYTLGEEEGQQRYGEKFHSSGYMLSFHHFNAALRDQDHIHEGNGFLLQHLKITSFFEDSLQAVDPALSLPYWDFTADDAAGLTARTSMAVKEELFGAMAEPVDLMAGFTYANDKIVDARIHSGRFKELRTERIPSDKYPSNGYGYMRAPWNMNPSPYISRYTFDFGGSIMLPTCDAHLDILQYDNMMDFFFKIAFAPHATVHTLIGGFYGCDVFGEMVDKGYLYGTAESLPLCSSWVFIMKELWRYGYITPSTDCVADENNLESSSCTFECTESKKDLLIEQLTRHVSPVGDITKEGAEDAWLDFICGGDGAKVFSGDHLESASPADPTFWVIHPTLERLLQAKFMSGGFLDESWATDAKNDYVCDKAKCYNEETGVLDYYETCCYGHFEHDQMLDGTNADRTSFVGPTNAEALAASDPRSKTYSTPFVYDKFEWSHCSSDFVDILSQMGREMGVGPSAHRLKNPSSRQTSQSETRLYREQKRVANAQVQ